MKKLSIHRETLVSLNHRAEDIAAGISIIIYRGCIEPSRYCPSQVATCGDSCNGTCTCGASCNGTCETCVNCYTQANTCTCFPASDSPTCRKPCIQYP